MSNREIYNVEFNIPRVNLQLPGRQNRTNDGILRFTPGMDEVIEFIFGNQDGVPLNLVPFRIKIVFWKVRDIEQTRLVTGQSEVIFAKEVEVVDPYSGSVVVLFTNEETIKISNEGITNLRWGLFMINEQGEVFPAQVDRNGGRYGTLLIDVDSQIPVAEIIKGA
jgi:hypothetical protein